MSNVDIPAQEVDLSTRRQRLFHVTWLNRSRLDKQCRPLLAELERSSDGGKMGILAKATFRGAVTIINHYFHFDIREHPSAIFLLLLKLMDDRSFDSIWDTYKPIVTWVDDDGSNQQGSNSPGETPPIDGDGGSVQLVSTTGLPTIDSGYEGIGQDDIQPDTVRKSNRGKTNSHTGLET